MTIYGCANPLNSTFEYNTLPINGDGHLKSDITYTYDGGSSYYTETFKSDGTYIFSYFEYEGTGVDLDGDGTVNEHWVQTYGTKGTYSYDEKNYKLTINDIQIYGDDLSTPATNFVWFDIALESSNPNYNANVQKSYQSYCIFLEHKYIFIYTGSNNSFIRESLRTYVDNKTIYYSNTQDFNTSGKILHTYIMQNKDAAGVVTSGTKTVSEYTLAATYPAGVEFENGKTVSFYRNFYNEKIYSWDVATSNWKTTPDIDTNYNEYYLYATFVKSSDGKVIYAIDEAYYRSKIYENLLVR